MNAMDKAELEDLRERVDLAQSYLVEGADDIANKHLTIALKHIKALQERNDI